MAGSTLSSYKVEQRRLTHRGREFHFVSYEPQVANERRGEPAVPAMWYLMNEGKRHRVMPHIKGVEIEVLDRELIAWLDAEIFLSSGDGDGDGNHRPRPR